MAAVCFGSYFIGSHIGVRGGLAWLLLLSHGAALPRRPRRRPLARPAAGGAARRVGCRWSRSACSTSRRPSLYGLANRAGLLSVVAVVGSLYPVATVVLARIALHERVDRVQAAGIGLALAGVALIGGG